MKRETFERLISAKAYRNGGYIHTSGKSKHYFASSDDVYVEGTRVFYAPFESLELEYIHALSTTRKRTYERIKTNPKPLIH